MRKDEAMKSNLEKAKSLLKRIYHLVETSAKKSVTEDVEMMVAAALDEVTPHCPGCGQNIAFCEDCKKGIREEATSHLALECPRCGGTTIPTGYVKAQAPRVKREDVYDKVYFHVSFMLDNPDEIGIYHTTKLYNELTDAIMDLLNDK